MKRTLLLLMGVLASLTMPAQNDLAVENIQNSGCLSATRGEEYVEPVPTIVLTKEGSTLSVEIRDYISNCATYDFEIKPSICDGIDGSPCSLSINVAPVLPEIVTTCECPFNVSFTIRDFEPNSFYLNCLWYKGMIELTKGESLVLEYNNPDPKELLYGEWRLVGWNDGGNWFDVDPKYVGHHHLSIEIPKEGYVKAYSMVNEIFLGLLTLNGNELLFDGDRLMTQVYCDIVENLFFEDHIIDIKSYQMDGKQLKLYYTDNDYFVFRDSKETGKDYRPFVEDGKVWKVGAKDSGNPVQWVEYYYFDGDTIIDGRTCKQMMRQRYVTPDYVDYDNVSQFPSLSYVGAWYEENEKVYFYEDTNKGFQIMYDFSLGAYDPLKVTHVLWPCVLGPRETGGQKGFKGVYRYVFATGEGHYYYNDTWLEGVGSIEGPTYNFYLGQEDYNGTILMSCTVGDEVIYYNDEYEDGATPGVMEANKRRIDFTHTVKTRPKAPKQGAAGVQLLYGEYSSLQLDIDLYPLDDTWQVCIADETGRTVYEKTVDAASIVGLNIDISDYTNGRYTVTVENDSDSFTGEFTMLATGISDMERLADGSDALNKKIYNLQGQRVSRLQRGLNIVDGQKVFIK